MYILMWCLIPVGVSASVGDAQASVSQLATLVTQVLESNLEISRRMENLEQQTLRRLPSTNYTSAYRAASLSPSLAEMNTTDDNESIATIKGSASGLQNRRNDELDCSFGFSFDQDLEISRPYTRAVKRRAVCSTTSSEIHTMGWSCLSGLSLAEVSHISVINLPVVPKELWNGERYFSSQFDPVGFVLSKPQSEPSFSLTTHSTPTRSRPSKTLGPVTSVQKGGRLSMIKEEVPVVARKNSLLGMLSALVSKKLWCFRSITDYINVVGASLSGKTTILNHLQLLYGNGISIIERLTASKDIERNLVHMFLSASHSHDMEVRSIIKNVL